MSIVITVHSLTGLSVPRYKNMTVRTPTNFGMVTSACVWRIITMLTTDALSVPCTPIGMDFVVRLRTGTSSPTPFPTDYLLPIYKQWNLCIIYLPIS